MTNGLIVTLGKHQYSIKKLQVVQAMLSFAYESTAGSWL